MSKQAVDEFLALLQRTYPAFREHMPLRIGTRQELARRHPTVTKSVMARTMACWCRNPAYLKALLAKDAKRYDLDAKPVGTVSAQERAHAREIQKQRKAQKAAIPAPVAPLEVKPARTSQPVAPLEVKPARTSQPVVPPAVKPARTAGSVNASKPVLSLKRRS